MHKKCLRSARACVHFLKTGLPKERKLMRSGLAEQQFSRGNDVGKS